MDRQKFRKALYEALQRQSGNVETYCSFLSNEDIDDDGEYMTVYVDMTYHIGKNNISGIMALTFNREERSYFNTSKRVVFMDSKIDDDYVISCDYEHLYWDLWKNSGSEYFVHWYDEAEPEEEVELSYLSMVCTKNGVNIKDVHKMMLQAIRKECEDNIDNITNVLDEKSKRDTLEESTKLSLVQYLKSKGWDEDEIAVLANGILTYKKWYKRNWRTELADDMNRAYYKPFGHSKRESGILQTFRNECGEYLAKITMKDLKELEQYLQ